MNVLQELLEDATAGDPTSGIKWTNRSLRKLQQALRRRRIPLARGTIARLLRQQRYSLRTNRKRLAGTYARDRDRQFRYLTRLRKLYRTLKFPVISVDSKKKEWVGNFKNPGRIWRRMPRDVLDHDPSPGALGHGGKVGRPCGERVLRERLNRHGVPLRGRRTRERRRRIRPVREAWARPPVRRCVHGRHGPWRVRTSARARGCGSST